MCICIYIYIFKYYRCSLRTSILVEYADPQCSEGMSCILCLRDAKAPPVDEPGVMDGLHVGTTRCAEVLVDGSIGPRVGFESWGSHPAARPVLVLIDDHEDRFHYPKED